MPSYAHYSQTLIPHMPVPPGSIHLHKHSPSVLHLPLWVSATGQIRKSQSPKLVLDTLWKKPLPNKLSHLERVAHRPDNLPLPTTITSLTWREVTHRLGMDLHWPVSHAQSSTAWPQQPTGKTDTGFPNRLRNHGIDSRFWFRDCTKVYRDSTHRLKLFRQRMYRLSQKSTQAFRLSGMHQGILAEVRPLTFRRSGRMEAEPPSRLISAILFACAWVDTCHPCNCMHSFSTRSFHLEVACLSKKNLG
jgi:hypothetical protein